MQQPPSSSDVSSEVSQVELPSPRTEPLKGSETPSSSASELQQACHLIESSEFVAIDLEFSGLFANYRKCSEIHSHYQLCVDNVTSFLAIQLGVCVVSRDPLDGDRWSLSPFNFYVFPSQRHVFRSDSGCMRWLSAQGFDFSKWVTQGLDYARLATLAENPGRSFESLQEIRTEGLQRIFEVIASCRKPLVVHNGLLDLLHVYDKFIGPLPPSIGQFAGAWHQLFGGGVYDTKRLAQEGKHSLFNLPDVRSLNLEELRHALLSKPARKTSFDFSAPRMEENPEYLLAGPYGEVHKKAHEAGFDAMVTAQVFVLELELLWRIQRQLPAEEDDSPNGPDESPRKRLRRNSGLEEASSPFDEASIPRLWGDLQSMRRLRNVIELPNVRPGELRLGDHITLPRAYAPPPKAFPVRQTTSLGGVPGKKEFRSNGPFGNPEQEHERFIRQLHPKLKELFERHEKIQRQPPLEKENERRGARVEAAGHDTTTASPAVELKSEECERSPREGEDPGTSEDKPSAKARKSVRRRRRRRTTSLVVASALQEAEAEADAVLAAAVALTADPDRLAWVR